MTNTVFKKLYDRLPGIWCEVNTRSEFTYVNKNYCHMVGAKNPELLIGKTVADLPCKASECAELFWKEDKKIITTQTEHKFLNIVQLANNEWNIIRLDKSPIFDDKQNLSSILFHIVIQNGKPMQTFGSTLAKAVSTQLSDHQSKQMSFAVDNPGSKISKKEQECLFFLLHGKTYKEIAEIQGVSQRTIIDQIESLKNKLNCNSKSELIGKAIDQGLNFVIPASFFRKQTSIDVD